MALLKAIEINDSNVFLSYWRVGPVGLDPDKDVTVLVLLGYLDEAARRASKRPGFLKRLSMKKLTLAEIKAAGDPWAAAYARLKAEPAYKDAQDV